MFSITSMELAAITTFFAFNTSNVFTESAVTTFTLFKLRDDKYTLSFCDPKMKSTLSFVNSRLLISEINPFVLIVSKFTYSNTINESDFAL